MPPNPTPKPFRGWAVYSPDGCVLCWTVSDTERNAKDAAEMWRSMQRRGYTCRRVIVTAEEGEGILI